MGSPISAIIADIVLDDIIKRTLEGNAFDIILLTKYVDDLFVIIHEDDVEDLFNAFNSTHRDFQFTMEIEVDGKIPYLDVQLIRHDGQIIYKWYKKPSNKGRLIDYWSSHPFHVKNNCIRSFAQRVLHSSHDIFHSECYEIIKNILSKNHYPVNLINKTINFAKHVPESQISTPQPRAQTIFHSITHCPPTSHKIKQYIEQTNESFKIIEKPHKKLSHILYTNTKSKIDTLQRKDVVYKINCGNCDKSYIGHTSKRLEQRILQHQNDCRLRRNKGYGTALSSHSLELHHNFDFENPEILDTEPNTFKRELKESIYIKKFQEKLVNFRVDSTRLHPTYNK